MSSSQELLVRYFRAPEKKIPLLQTALPGQNGPARDVPWR